MTRWQPLKTDVIAALVDDISHNYGAGRATVSVASGNPAAAEVFADLLAAAFESSGRAAARSTLVEAALPERTDATADSLLVVSGPTVTDPALRGAFNYGVWLDDRTDERRDRTARAAASAIIDNTDPEHPHRVFTDSC